MTEYTVSVVRIEHEVIHLPIKLQQVAISCAGLPPFGRLSTGSAGDTCRNIRVKT